MASKPFTFSQRILPSILGEVALRANRKWTGKQNQQERDRILKASGSPGFRPSRSQAKQVETMAAMGLSEKEIGSILGVEKNLIKFYYEYEIKTAKLRALMPVMRAAYEMAGDKRHPEMTKFVLQCQAGWTPSTKVEHSGVDKDADDARAAREALLQGDDVSPPTGGRTT